MSEIVIATVQTRNFDWLAVASRQSEAEAILLDAWDRHCEQYQGADGMLMTRLINEGEVTFRYVRTGMVLRDGEVLVSR